MDDCLIAVDQVVPEDAIFGDRKVIMITKKGMSLGFPLAEVNEFKKTSRGLKGITLADGDEETVSVPLYSLTPTSRYSMVRNIMSKDPAPQTKRQTDEEPDPCKVIKKDVS